MIKSFNYHGLSIDGWSNFLQNEINHYNNLKIAVIGIILGLFAIICSITLAFFNLELFIYTVVVIIIFTVFGVLYLGNLEKKKIRINKLLIDIINGKFNRASEVYQRWLSLTRP